MKKQAIWILVLILIVVFSAVAWAEEKNSMEPFTISRPIYEQIKAAEEVYWAGGRNILLKNETGYRLIDLQACEVIPLPISLPEDYGEFHPRMIGDGWVADSNENYYCFFNLRSGCSLVKRQDPDKPYKEYNVWDTWTNPDTGASILLYLGDDFSEVYGESGELLNRLEWKASSP